MTEAQINCILDDRLYLLENEGDVKIIDLMTEEINSELKTNFNQYPVDFIIETLTKLGGALSLVYDDNGMFAVSSDGFQPVITGDDLIEGIISILVEKKQWKETIREALFFYLSDNEE